MKVNTEFNCSIIPINPDTGYKMPYDIEIVDYKLIIEVNGEQHYNIFKKNHPWLDGLSPEEYLKKRKQYDRYKKNYALSCGYNYLEIPYTALTNQNYISLIDNKINKIKNNLQPCSA